MKIDRIMLEDIELRQHGQLVRVTFPDGTTCDVIATLTDDKDKQKRIVSTAGKGCL